MTAIETLSKKMYTQTANKKQPPSAKNYTLQLVLHSLLAHKIPSALKTWSTLPRHETHQSWPWKLQWSACSQCSLRKKCLDFLTTGTFVLRAFSFIYLSHILFLFCLSGLTMDNMLHATIQYNNDVFFSFFNQFLCYSYHNNT